MLKAQRVISWIMLVVGFIGFIVSFPLWLMNLINDRMLLGITFVLSWASLWYGAFVAIQVQVNERERRRDG